MDKIQIALLILVNDMHWRHAYQFESADFKRFICSSVYIETSARAHNGFQKHLSSAVMESICQFYGNELTKKLVEITQKIFYIWLRADGHKDILFFASRHF